MAPFFYVSFQGLRPTSENDGEAPSSELKKEIILAE
jgi:hypothetical protein